MIDHMGVQVADVEASLAFCVLLAAGPPAPGIESRAVLSPRPPLTRLAPGRNGVMG
ncbi:MAG TPA: hypothetical protein VF933_12495 [Streptosporangiaceae bacterium]